MLNLKVAKSLKRLVDDTADACQISTAAVMRKVAMRLESGTIRMTAARDEIAMHERDGIIHHVTVPMSLLAVNNIKAAWIKSEMTIPQGVSERDYRLALAGACLDTMEAIHALRLRERYGRSADAPVRSAAAEAAR